MLGIGLLGPCPSRPLPNVIKQLTSSKHTQIQTRTHSMHGQTLLARKAEGRREWPIHNMRFLTPFTRGMKTEKPIKC